MLNYFIYVYMYRNILTTFTISHPWTGKNGHRKQLQNSFIINNSKLPTIYQQNMYSFRNKELTLRCCLFLIIVFILV